MAKETKPAEKAEGEKSDVAGAVLTACATEPGGRETFLRFMLAVAGRDDANYKTAPKMADDAAALTDEYLKRRAKYEACPPGAM